LIIIAWDSNKVDGVNGVPASEWNTHVTDQKSRLLNVVEDTTPQLGGELDSGAHSIGFTLNTLTTNTIDWRLGNKAAATLTANSTIYFIAPSKPCNLCFVVTQNTTGTGQAITWDTTVRWSGGVAPSLTTTTSKSDVISFMYNGTSYLGLGSLNF
jgi:hypothetical protein